MSKPGVTREKVLGFIKQYIEEYGYAPSIPDICVGCGLCTNSNARYHVVKLQDEGKIAFTPHTARSIRVL